MSKIVKDSSITFMTRLLLFLLSIGTSLVVSRVLGPSLKGTYSILVLIVSATSLLVLFGLGSANVYYGSRNPSQLPVLAGNSFIAAFGLGVLGIILVEFATLSPAFRSYLLENNIAIRQVQLIILLLPLIQLNAYLKEILRANGNMVRYNLIALWRSTVNLAGVLIFVWLLRLGLKGAISSWILSIVAVMLLTIWWVLKVVRGHVGVDWAALRRNFSFGIRLYPGNIAQFLNYRLDIFLVGYFLTPTEVGLYVTATALAEKLWEIPHAINTVMLHHIASLDDSQSANATTARVGRVVTLTIGLLCLFLVVISYPLIKIIYGEPYLPSVLPLIALMPGIWFLGVGKLFATHLSASGRPEIGTIGAIISLSVTLLLDVFLIPRIGIIGAAIASSASYMLSTSVFVGVFLRSAHFGLADILIIRREDMAILRRAFNGLLLRVGVLETLFGEHS